jgi:hypothetical protein
LESLYWRKNGELLLGKCDLL